MSHLHSAPSQDCLSTNPIIDLLSLTYPYKFLFSPVVSYSLAAFLASCDPPLRLSVSGSVTQMHTKRSRCSNCPGRAPSVILCPIFLFSFASKCWARQCVRVLVGFVLAPVRETERNKMECEESEDNWSLRRRTHKHASICAAGEGWLEDADPVEESRNDGQIPRWADVQTDN